MKNANGNNSSRKKLNPVFFRRVCNAGIACFNYARWSWRFGRFPFRCRLGTPDNLTKPQAITFGHRVTIRKGARLEAIGPWDGKTPKITIGDNTGIMYYFHCGAIESVKIGRNVLIASRVYITDHDHAFDDPQLSAKENPKLVSAPVVLEDGCWLGEGVVILKGVTVGQRAVVGANSVVTKDVPPWTIVGGVPAKVIRKLEPSPEERGKEKD